MISTKELFLFQLKAKMHLKEDVQLHRDLVEETFNHERGVKRAGNSSEPTIYVLEKTFRSKGLEVLRVWQDNREVFIRKGIVKDEV